MVNVCAVRGCSHRSDRESCKFHRLPCISHNTWKKNKPTIRKRQIAWLRVMRRKDIPPKQRHLHRVCACHFIEGNPARLSDRDNPDWIPTLKMPGSTPSTQSERNIRYIRRTELKNSACANSDSGTSPATSPVIIEPQVSVQQEVLHLEVPGSMQPDMPGSAQLEGPGCVQLEVPDYVQLDLPPDNSSCTVLYNSKSTENVVSQTDLTSTMLEQLEQSHQSYVSETAKLRNQLSKFSGNGYPELEAFRHDSKLVTTYTGLPSFQVLEALFNFLLPVIAVTETNKLTQFQLLTVVLMKLTLNLTSFDLAFRFKVSESTISSSFNRLILAFGKHLAPILHWPSREELSQTMPYCFERVYGRKVVGLIDCFEIFTEKASDLFAKAATYSQYKSYNTAKYLICVTPQGTVSYISEGYGGRVSDKFITEHYK